MVKPLVTLYFVFMGMLVLSLYLHMKAPNLKHVLYYVIFFVVEFHKKAIVVMIPSLDVFVFLIM